MHAVELLEEAKRAARTLGYRIREECLDGGGGACEFAGHQWLFLDAAHGTADQLGLVLDALRQDPRLPAMTRRLPLSGPLLDLLRTPAPGRAA